MRFLYFLLPIFVSTLQAAETTSLPPIRQTSELTLWELLLAGGWVMIPLLAVSFIALVLILFYFLTLRESRIATEKFRKSLEAMIQDKNVPGIAGISRNNPQLLARVMERTVEFIQANPEADMNAIKEIAQTEGSRQANSVQQQVVYLMDLGVLAPMLGLFGTVIGILRSFGTIASSDIAPMRTMMLAGGVSQALVATATGLIVGITAMFFYSYFRGRVQGYISLLETTSTQLVIQLGLKLKK